MATLPEMLDFCHGDIKAAEQIARKLGPEHALDLQLLLCAQGKWSEAAEINATRPRTNPREVYAGGLFSIIEGDLPGGIFQMHVGRSDGLFGSASTLPGEMLTPDKLDTVAGKTVLMRGEGGYGDEIINVRFAKTLSDLGAKVVVSCRPDLASVFARVDGVGATISHNSEQFVYYDYWLPAMSAPGILQVGFHQLSSAHYLTPNPKAVEAWSGIMGEKAGRRIGIKWMGNPAFEHEQFRRFPPRLLFDAIEGESDVWSLDMDSEPPEGIKNAAPFINGWEDTLGAIASCDMIITSCTSVAHAAAAMGKPTAVIVPVMPYYTWARPIEGDTSKWYDSVTLYRQEVFGDWSHPFEKLKEALHVV